MKKALIIVSGVLLVGIGAFIGIRKICDTKASNDIYKEAQDKYVLSVREDSASEGENPGNGSGANDQNESESGSGVNIWKDMLETVGIGGQEDVAISEKTSGNSGDGSASSDGGSDADEFAAYSLDGTWQDKINVDLAALSAQYPDVKGWLYFENEDISYPIVQAYSDDKYMRMSYTGEKVSAGSIFMEALNANDFTDAHTIIYGHNMKNHSMFGRLRNYLEQPKYYAGHQYFQIIKLNPDGKIEKNRYKIFAYCKTNAASKIYTVCREHDNYYADVINSILLSSANNTGIPVSAENYVVTLSTCSNGDNRLTVSGVLVDVSTQ